MHVCHATLRGLTMNLLAPDAAVRRRQRHAVAWCCTNSAPSVRARHRPGRASATHDGRWAWTDVPAQGSSTVQVAFKPERRGLHPVPPLTAETRFPLGTFRVWTVWRPAAQVLVYPAPEPYPAAAAAGRAARRRRRDGAACRTPASSTACAPTGAATR